MAERQHYVEVLHSFRDYSAWMGLEARRRERHAAGLPERYKRLLPSGSLEAKATALRQAIELNQALLDAVCDAQLDSGFAHSFDIVAAPPQANRIDKASPSSSEAHFSKVRSTLHQLVRDWSSEGATERDQSYGYLSRTLAELLPVNDANRNKQRVLVPGCGLGRLVFDLTAAGYATQGNEFSLQMLFASHFVLNCQPMDEETSSDGQVGVSLCPWIHDPSNHLRTEDMMRIVMVPDVLPGSLLRLNPGADMSMTAGEFGEIYAAPEHKGAWDAVLTCFFIDTAPVPMEYIDVISHCLKPGGVWVNCGPLQYHWATRATADEEEAAVGSSREEREGGSADSGGDGNGDGSAAASSGTRDVPSAACGHTHDHSHAEHGHSHGGAPEAAGRESGGRPDDRFERSCELTYQELRHAIVASGFSMLKEGSGKSTYAANRAGLSRTLYTTLNFACRRGGL